MHAMETYFTVKQNIQTINQNINIQTTLNYIYRFYTNLRRISYYRFLISSTVKIPFPPCTRMILQKMLSKPSWKWHWKRC